MIIIAVRQEGNPVRDLEHFSFGNKNIKDFSQAQRSCLTNENTDNKKGKNLNSQSGCISKFKQNGDESYRVKSKFGSKKPTEIFTQSHNLVNNPPVIASNTTQSFVIKRSKKFDGGNYGDSHFNIDATKISSTKSAMRQKPQSFFSNQNTPSQLITPGKGYATTKSNFNQFINQFETPNNAKNTTKTNMININSNLKTELTSENLKKKLTLNRNFSKNSPDNESSNSQITQEQSDTNKNFTIKKSNFGIESK